MLVLRLGDEILVNCLDDLEKTLFGQFGENFVWTTWRKLSFWTIVIEIGQRFYLELGRRWNGQDCCYSWVFKQIGASEIAMRGECPMGR
jgi:hypothetical protein